MSSHIKSVFFTFSKFDGITYLSNLITIKFAYDTFVDLFSGDLKLFKRSLNSRCKFNAEKQCLNIIFIFFR